MVALIVAALAVVQVPADSVPLQTDLGRWTLAVGTKVPLAQRYFDQGLALSYGFNHAEALSSFRYATRLDPDCAMCYWGIAFALGPNINAPMDTSAIRPAWEAVQTAQRLASRASVRDRAYIAALAKRYGAPPALDRARLDSAYAAAMRDVARAYADDPDAQSLFADGRMNLSPWNYWTDGRPRPGTEEIVSTLERTLARQPDHIGACHFYIHAIEASRDPGRAVPCAERLANLVPGAGHLVHMPAHIYVRVGRYGDAVDANLHAVHTDEAFIEGRKPEGLYPIAYYPHNYHFLAFAATLAGRSAQAIDAARKTAATTPVELAKQVPQVEPYLHYPFFTLVTFGRWDELLGMALPPADLAYSRAMGHYARGVALAAKGRFGDAQAALDTVRQLAQSGVAAYASAGWGTPSTNLQIAEHALAGEIAGRAGRATEAVEHFRAALKIEDEQLYTEPPDWYYPIRHSLGAALLKAGRPAEAEELYRQNLTRFPENGWALFGLAQALRAQKRDTEAALVDEQFRKAWTSADITLTGSRF